MMDCNDFEERLEALAEGELGLVERQACEGHAARCAACGELLAMASLETAPGAAEDEAWLREVIARTSGSACAQPEEAQTEAAQSQATLCAFVDGVLPAAERQEVADHLGRCAECTALVAVLRDLGRELPRLAEVRPDGRFVEEVLARTLPVPVRLRRFWERNWPRWMRRPRFASEAAYVGVLALVLIFATPGSPLEAVPAKALETVRTVPRADLAAPVAAAGKRVEDALARARAGAHEIEDAIEAAMEGKLGTSWGTLRGEIASLLGKAEAPVPEPADSSEETP